VCTHMYTSVCTYVYTHAYTRCLHDVSAYIPQSSRMNALKHDIQAFAHTRIHTYLTGLISPHLTELAGLERLCLQHGRLRFVMR